MPKVSYYALVNDRHPVGDPSGIVRRTHTEPRPVDEALGRDMEWHPTEFLYRHWLGHNDQDYVEITEEAALALISRWKKEITDDQ